MSSTEKFASLATTSTVGKPGKIAPAPALPIHAIRKLKEPMQIGEAVKRLRKEKGFSLTYLSQACGVSAGMLSQIERDAANPSLRVLIQILDALDAPMSELFDQRNKVLPEGASFLRRKEDHPQLEFRYLRKELLSAGADHNLQLMILHIPPGGSSGPQQISYSAEKGGIVLESELVLRVGEEEATIKEGDSFIFDANNPHSFFNPTTSETKVLWVIGKLPIERHL